MSPTRPAPAPSPALMPTATPAATRTAPPAACRPWAGRWAVAHAAAVLLAAGALAEPLLRAAWAGERAAQVQAQAFERAGPAVRTRSDERWLYVESDGLPAHQMMVGITAWQQQVPLPQPYRGSNAWQVPLVPRPAAQPLSAKTGFFRGAIALAVNGVPIFNPIKNDGRTDTLLAGELDEFGGHCGRGDDYHYHVAPVFLNGGDASRVVAYALDGYAIYGFTEADGKAPKGLDALNGHEHGALGYHYHATKAYPYLNGGFHGEVVEREGQVDPQPRADPVREALPPLPGATITGFERSKDGRSSTLSYEQGGRKGSVRVVLEGEEWVLFTFTAPDGSTREERYRRRGSGEPGARPPGERPAGDRPPGDRPPGEGRGGRKQGGKQGGSPGGGGPGGGAQGSPQPGGPQQGGGPPGGEPRQPSLLAHIAELDSDRDGVLTRAEVEADIERTLQGYDHDGDGVVSTAERDGGGVRTSLGGFVQQHWPELDPDGDGRMDRAALARVALGMFTRSDRDGDGRLQAADFAASGGRPGGRGEQRGEQQQGEQRGEQRGEPARGPQQQGGPQGVLKPTAADTLHGTAYADNWFMLYVNGKPVAVDPIDFLPHNVVELDLLPEYPMTIAVLAKDNADPATGLEYGSQVGDAGFILRFADGTVTDARWKARCFHHGPVGGDTRQPRVEASPLPERWWAVDFDDRDWPQAVEYAAEAVRPPPALDLSALGGARFIWTRDLELDNTVIFRVRIERPGWAPRWTTRPDLDVREAPAG
ncbi:MAG: YHYH protein [Planctomycetia bacterium]